VPQTPDSKDSVVVTTGREGDELANVLVGFAQRQARNLLMPSDFFGLRELPVPGEQAFVARRVPTTFNRRRAALANPKLPCVAPAQSGTLP
jgi:hypothetical protein